MKAYFTNKAKLISDSAASLTGMREFDFDAIKRGVDDAEANAVGRSSRDRDGIDGRCSQCRRREVAWPVVEGLSAGEDSSRERKNHPPGRRCRDGDRPIECADAS